MSDIQDLLDRYWQLAYAEGRENRQHDTENGDAQECRSAIEGAIERLRKALEESRAVIVALRPPERGGLCWCWYSHDIERCGHQIQCVNARAALDAVKEG